MEIKSRLFENVDAQALSVLFAHMERKEVARGEKLRKEGQTCDSAFFLLEGAVSVTKRSGDEDVEVATVRGGEDVCFSLTSLIDGGVSLTTLSVTEAGAIAVLEKDVFEDFCKSHADAGVILKGNILSALAGFLRQADGKIAEMYKTLEEVL
ncbi:cyclic nucleotide-binding domain-containing protein [Hydrogenimonas sp. SS33]|uniref:Crp/Fnr family transcriptional regulator n=1 Tax=Hydrogenimonas leucolamina TaxID=2954236 RepID=UPI00336BE5CE